MIARNMTECQLVEKTGEESVKMVSAELASAKNKRESRIGCSCVSITLPASSEMRITASCERLKNFAYSIALLIDNPDCF
jgi:hypothetical protein